MTAKDYVRIFSIVKIAAVFEKYIKNNIKFIIKCDKTSFTTHKDEIAPLTLRDAKLMQLMLVTDRVGVKES